MITLLRKEHQMLEYAAHRFIIDASDLRLAPGYWPDYIETDYGNHRPLYPHHTDSQGGRVYQQELGCIQVTIAND